MYTPNKILAWKTKVIAVFPVVSHLACQILSNLKVSWGIALLKQCNLETEISDGIKSFTNCDEFIEAKSCTWLFKSQ